MNIHSHVTARFLYLWLAGAYVSFSKRTGEHTPSKRLHHLRGQDTHSTSITTRTHYSSLKSGLLISQKPCMLATRMAPPKTYGRTEGGARRRNGKAGAQTSGVRNFHSKFVDSLSERQLDDGSAYRARASLTA